tara:strand:- start:4360 stop:5031 length:672 start_codon:yes stop_codon:yes gene_type:complete
MPYKTGKLKGELTAPELRRLIKEHNKLMSIKIPPKTDRDGLLKLIEDNKYKVNHEQQKLVPVVQMKRKPSVKLPPPPAKKTTEEKEEDEKKKNKKKLEDNLKLKMKVQKVKSKVSDSEMKAEPKKEKPPPINKATPPPIKKTTPPPIKSDKKKSEPKQIDEELWTEFKELVEENKDKLLNIIRPEDKKLKNQYDYYISKYNDRKKPDSLPAKKMMALLKRKLK